MERDHLKGASVDAINVSQGGRQYLPNGIDLTTIDNQREPGRIAYSLNTRPRAVPGFQTPGEVFMAELTKPGGAHPG
jgi:IS30 family transposase